MNKVIEIFKSWGIAFNPNDAQAEQAAKRLEICESCEHRADTPIKHCSKCGCALKGKIYSPVVGACPEKKWNDVDVEFVLRKLQNGKTQE